MRFDEILPDLIATRKDFYRKGWNATKLHGRAYVYFEKYTIRYDLGVFVFYDGKRYIPNWMPSIMDLLADDWEVYE